MQMLVILLLPLFTFEALAEDAISVKLKDISYGITAVRKRNVTGSYIQKRATRFEIVEVTNQIPLAANTQFGFSANVHSNYGKTLQIITVLIGPDGSKDPKHNAAISIKNGEEVRWLSNNQRGLSPGQWTLKLYLVGVDSSIAEILASKDEPRSMKLYEKTFNLYRADS
jgi:hypothetical protein